jgi:putative sigma-54 modulation protein
MGISDDVKHYCTEKVQKLTRYYDRIQSIEVVLDGNMGSHRAEIIIHADRTDPFIANENHNDIHAAFDVACDKVKQQLLKHKEKLRNRKHSAARPQEEPAE